MNREPQLPTPRKAMTRHRRFAVLCRQDGYCARKDCRLPAVEIDHIVPLELGGSEEDENLAGLCKAHHQEKTKEDVKRIAKARRLRKREAGEVRAKRPIVSRGFSTHLRRLFNGTVVATGGEQ